MYAELIVLLQIKIAKSTFNHCGKSNAYIRAYLL